MRPGRQGTSVHVPWDVRICAILCVVLFVGYGILYAILYEVDRELAAAMIRLFALTIAAGRETALFDAERNGMPLGMAIGLSVVDDIATLLLNITVVWFLVAALQRTALARRILARVETKALRHRAWVRKWGLYGLALFYMLPGFGSGPAVAAGIGVLARIPAGRLALVLGSGVALVDIFWAVVVARPATSYPDVAWLDWLPLYVMLLLATIVGIGMWRDRHNRGVVLLDWEPDSSPAHLAAMEGWGIRLSGGLVEARLSHVAQATGLPKSRALFALELLLLDGMDPQRAAALVQNKVLGVRDVAGLDTGKLQAATKQATSVDPVGMAQAEVWHGQAVAMVERSGSAWKAEEA